jgi:iron complex transport system substrate-binding protein
MHNSALTGGGCRTIARGWRGRSRCTVSCDGLRLSQIVHLAAADLSGVYSDMQRIADALGIGERGRRLVKETRAALAAAGERCRGRPRPKVACIQWSDPWYCSLSCFSRSINT